MTTFDISAFNGLFSIGGKEKYIELNNTVGQRWYIPFHNPEQFISLFQPSSLKGKLFAKAIQWIKYFPRMLCMAHAKIVTISFSKEFHDYIDDVFSIQHGELGIFCGSPGHHQKPTLLVCKGKRILGYCKFTDKEDIYTLFAEECKHLDYLHSSGVNHVPKALFFGQLDFCDLYAFVQTTERHGRVKKANYLSRELIDFIKDLNHKTAQNLAFDESDFAHALLRLRSNLIYLGNKHWSDMIEKGIEVIENNKIHFNQFYASHGDLTAWNSFIVDDHLFAFDLEYFKQSYPLLCDYFHFFTQDLLYNGYADTTQIWDKYMNVKERFMEVYHLDLYYLAYLLVIVDFYLNRDKGLLNERLESCFTIWTELIEKLIEDDKEID